MYNLECVEELNYLGGIVYFNVQSGVRRGVKLLRWYCVLQCTIWSA